MPPRARKTAAPAPSLEDAAAAAEQPETTEATGAVEPETPDAASEPEPTASVEGASAGAEPPAPDGDTESEQPEPAPAEAVTFHWESVKNDGSEPCRLCTPGGPPPGAGSFGCSHGQWVRVQDAA
jgi:hypothetical protein